MLWWGKKPPLLYSLARAALREFIGSTLAVLGWLQCHPHGQPQISQREPNRETMESPRETKSFSAQREMVSVFTVSQSLQGQHQILPPCIFTEAVFARESCLPGMIEYFIL